MALESIKILKREARHMTIEMQKQNENMAYTTTSISLPKAVSKNKHEN
jgi:hypothetical protein